MDNLITTTLLVSNTSSAFPGGKLNEVRSPFTISSLEDFVFWRKFEMEVVTQARELLPNLSDAELSNVVENKRRDLLRSLRRKQIDKNAKRKEIMR